MLEEMAHIQGVHVLYTFTKIPKQALWSLKGLMNKKSPEGPLNKINHSKFPKDL